MKIFQFFVSGLMALGAFLGILFLLWIGWGYFSVLGIEAPQYTVLEQREGYEIREYPSFIVAETTSAGGFDGATSDGFMEIAEYIFGDNQEEASVSMTRPVTFEVDDLESSASMKVLEETGDQMKVAFVMPSLYSMATLPRPNSKDVSFREIPVRRVAAIHFSGWFKEALMQEKKEALVEMLKKDGVEYSRLYFVGYNPPWTPPFMMRNEVWAELVE